MGGYVNPVKDQRSCGSCWAFSTIATAESSYFKATGKLLSFSEQDLVSCDKAGNNGCSGGMPGEAMDWIVKNGLPLESEYPYTGKDSSCESHPAAAQFLSWSYIDSHGSSGEQKLLAGLQNEHPISIVVNANNAWQSYHGGILTSSNCPAGNSINHAVQAVGYGTGGGSPYWIIRNSWGSSWGEAGYMRMAYGQGACSVTACFSAFIMAGPPSPVPPTPPTPVPPPTPPPPPPPPTPVPPPPPQPCSFHFSEGECGSSKEQTHACVWCQKMNMCFRDDMRPSFCDTVV